ncbi:Alpha-D-ribose 1-methylphosphonate 5-triphosphate diphosphatase [Pelotomaculum sp. FP]|uniref:alpha-D-ribose 1-methylphosphonate 5-triphosphate diphosphatase n=1 Tax=Pelotomaculum sp. FP TaxID=261474 RepID=UPI001065CC9B|nr:alpha-D-ribose 1-methylphosphonate 5-triphosphate diphosphatase [Pelotomaculum sp. FP]TEB14879.1 Alpha-D-ribose 1-methylphosphonate 5-triphosphate diphosphatase [Pelotomaculum sp. FP]
MKKIIQNGRIVSPGGIIEGSIILDDTKISRIIEGDSSLSGLDTNRGAETIDAGGCYIMPGLVDFHCDLLEYAIQPRKKVFFPINLALHSIQAQFLAAGITTVFHPVSFAGEPGLRSNDMGQEIVRAIARFRREETAMLRHFIHVRYELNNKAGLHTVGRIFEEGLVDLFSVTDHSPRYAKFKTYHEYKSYIEKNSTLTAEQLEAYTKAQWEMPEEVDNEVEQQLLMYVAKHNVPFATHDDDSPQRVDAYRHRGATISEFPLNEEAARHALNHKMYSVVGAPNLLRNKSHTNNLSARYAIHNGLANIICSDYYCNALLASVFILFEEGISLNEAVSYAALNPARAVGLGDRLGSLEEGKEADIILVHHTHGELPVVERAMVEGRWRYGA